jgi:beta-fructofuranosidase
MFKSALFKVFIILMSVIFYAQACPQGDLNGDCCVDMLDLGILAQQWLSPGCNEPGIVGHWLLDDASGSNAIDSSGYGYDGSLFGNPSWTNDVLRGWCLSFDGSDDYVLIGNESAFDISESITVSAWVKADASGNRFQYIVSKGTDSWRLYRRSGTGLYFACTGLSGNNYILGSSDVLGDGQWHHIAGVYDSGQEKLLLYVDGQLDNSVAASGLISLNDTNVTIGSSLSANFWTGQIDDVRVYSRALSASEVALIKSGANIPDPYCANLDGVNGINAKDFATLAENWGVSYLPILISDFEGSTYDNGWQVTGTAFGPGPAAGTLPNQNPVTGFLGNRLVNTYFNGDGTTGTLTSPEFTIQRPYINFLIGGGYHPGQTCINLLQNGSVVRTATGESLYGWDTEYLHWYTWDVSALIGSSVRIQIVDNYTGGWGHVNIDQIEQSYEWKMVSYANAAISRAMHAMQAAEPKAESDPMRPVFHFRAPAQWMNDPVGPFYYNGYYHIFYQLEPYHDYWTNMMHWGHARSTDLVKWEHLPIALWPSLELGEEGCFSGGATINKNGTPMLFYTSVDHPIQQQWAAIPADQNLIQWTKHPANPVLTTAANGGLNFHDWRDPCIFIYEGVYYMVLGGNINGRGAITIYRALNDALTSWQYLGILFQNPDPEVFNIECPNFFQLGNKWVLVCDTKGRAGSFVGTFNTQNFTFTPESQGWIDHSWQYYATNFLKDPQGRIVMWAWVKGFAENQGWNGCLSLPRVLSLRQDNTLSIDPLPELQILRSNKHSESNIELRNSSYTVKGVEGTSLEIIAKFVSHDAANMGLRLLTDDGTVAMTMKYGANIIDVDGTTSPLKLAESGELTIHVYLDKSLVEVYLNDGRVCITRVIWPYYKQGNLKIQIFAEGGYAVAKTIDVWQINSIW